MKIRIGFVSNSSSSSFLIYGASFEGGEFSDEYQKAEIDEYDFFENLASKTKSLCYTQGEEGYSHYLGVSWDSIKDDETGAQFKARIQADVDKLFPGKDIKCGTHEEAWRDG